LMHVFKPIIFELPGTLGLLFSSLQLAGAQIDLGQRYLELKRKESKS